MRFLFGVVLVAALLACGCGDNRGLTTAPVVQQPCDDDDDCDDRDDGARRDTLRTDYPWPTRPPK